MANILIEYDKKKQIVYIHAQKKDFVPKYLDYLLEFYNIPKTAKRIFTKEGDVYVPDSRPN